MLLCLGPAMASDHLCWALPLLSPEPSPRPVVVTSRSLVRPRSPRRPSRCLPPAARQNVVAPDPVPGVQPVVVQAAVVQVLVPRKVRWARLAIFWSSYSSATQTGHRERGVLTPL